MQETDVEHEEKKQKCKRQTKNTLETPIWKNESTWAHSYDCNGKNHNSTMQSSSFVRLKHAELSGNGGKPQ